MPSRPPPPALEPGWDLVGSFAVIGTYVGVIPVVLGMLWLPFVRRISPDKYRFFLAVTAGLLLFLGIDSIEEALGVANESLAASFNGVLLVATVLVLSFLGLYYAAGRLTGSAGPLAVSMMVAVAIGLHNFGEGLAIGAAVGLGSAAFSAFLIVGFALHNTTEGLAIAAPVSKVGDARGPAGRDGGHRGHAGDIRGLGGRLCILPVYQRHIPGRGGGGHLRGGGSHAGVDAQGRGPEPLERPGGCGDCGRDAHHVPDEHTRGVTARRGTPGGSRRIPRPGGAPIAGALGCL